jgi:putative tricarboxylic transport membrane protein
MWREKRAFSVIAQTTMQGDNKLHWADIRRILPFIGMSAVIGTAIGALPGIGSTLAATLGYATGRKMHKGEPKFGEGAMEGVAATEAANSSVAGANLIPVLSLGIPGNVSAVFIILAAESIGGFDPGPSVFRFTEDTLNPELVIAFGLFTMMLFANGLNWTIGGIFMRVTGVMVKIPIQILLPVVLLVTLTAIYAQKTDMVAVYMTVFFGLIGYLMRKLEISVLPFVIAYILANNLEEALRRAFAASGADPWFMLKSPIAMALLALAVLVIFFFSRRPKNPLPEKQFVDSLSA